jgi:glucan biosynthesis protein C
MYEVAVWLMIIGLLGLFHRFLDRTTRVYAYAVESAYPFYVLHQTVLVALAYFVVRLDVGLPVKYALIALSTLTWTLVVYELAVRRWIPMRTLFGMKRRRVTLPE